MNGEHTHYHMADTSSVAPTALDGLLLSLLGLTLADLNDLPERLVVDAVGQVARHAGADQALLLLDARNGEESLTVADQRVRLLLDVGRREEAVAAARDRLARKDSLPAKAQLARALLNAGAVDAAAQVADAMLEVAPDKVTPLYIAGLVALARRHTSEARSYFERLLQLHEDSPTGLRGLARVALAEGDPVAALDLAGQALDRYSEPPTDLVRELQLYAARCGNEEPALLAARRAEETLAALDQNARARLTTALSRARERPDRAHSRRAVLRSDDENAIGDTDESGLIPALPPAPPLDPSARAAMLATLHETFGYDTFRPGQEDVISAVLSGRDTLAVMPTGAGKSLCYQLPSLLREGLTLVISPLIALMKDQVDSLPAELLAQTTLINSSLETAELTLRLGGIAAGRYRLVYAAPERLRQRPFIYALARAGVSLAVIDEAHCLSMWGHDFRPDYLFIRAALADLGRPQVLAMTATATPEMMNEIASQLGRDFCAVNTGVLRDNLFLMAQRAENEDHKMRLLLPFVQRQGPGIVYVNSRETAEKLERKLRQARINARAYHAGMGPAERGALQDRFMGGQLRVMVATVAFGMGVDKADVRFIVHFNPARSLEAYSQESGRAGRDGKPSICLLLHSTADRANLTRWSKEQAVDIDGLRAVYRVLRGLVRGTHSLGDADALRDRLETEGHGAIDLRVAISILEVAGLLHRGPDAPRGATVSLRDNAPAPGADKQWDSFVQAAHLEAALSATVDLPALARALEVDEVALEDRLLSWQAERRLIYRGVGREMLIEMVPPPPDTAERMAAILDGMGRRNRRRLRSLFAYLDTDRCRHYFIARHFGHAAAEHCNHCDVCRPVTLDVLQPPVGPRVDDPEEAVRRLVAQFPLGYGKSGVVEVLKGVTTRRLHAERTELFGSLAHLPKAAIERVVVRLLAEGDLVTEDYEGYPVLRPG